MVEAAIALFCLVLPVSIAGTNIAAGALTAAILLDRKVDLRRLKNPAIYALGLYLAAAVLVSAAGADPRHSFAQLHKDFHKLWVLGLLLLALPMAGSFRPARALGLGFAFIAVFSIFHGLEQRFSTHLWYRAHGFVHPVTFGAQMALACLAGLCYLARGAAQKEKTASRAWLAAMALALVFSQTRGAWLGLAAGYAALCAVDASFRRQGLWALAAGTAGFAVMEAMPNGRSLLASLHGAGGQWDRLLLWRAAAGLFAEHPFLGVGPGNFRAVFDVPVQGEAVWTSAHNLFLHQAAERGLLGLAALLSFLYVLTARAFERARKNATAWNLWALGAMAAFLVMNLTEVSFQNEQVMTLVLFIWAWAEANHTPAAN